MSFEISPLSLGEGDYVTASDGVTAKFHQITGLTLTSVDPDTNIISGTAAAGAEISVWVRECDVVENVTADGSGDWAIDFTPTCSIEPGFLGKVWDLDPDNDASTIIWYIPNPVIDVYSGDFSIDAVDWPEGADLHLCVGSVDFPASIDPGAWTTECDLFQDNQTVPPPDLLWTRTNYYTDPHVLANGNYVTVSDGVTAKHHLVSVLDVLVIDPDLDVIAGVADPGKEVGIWINECDLQHYEFADPGGDWLADVSGMCNIEPGFHGQVWDWDVDGDSSNH